MSNTLRVLVLCATDSTIYYRKSLHLINSFDLFNNVSNLNITFIGDVLLTRPRLYENDYNNLAKFSITPYTKLNINFLIVQADIRENNTDIGQNKYDIILDENCPKTATGALWGITPEIYISIINTNLKKDGLYIGKKLPIPNSLIEIRKNVPDIRHYDGIWNLYKKKDVGSTSATPVTTTSAAAAVPIGDLLDIELPPGLPAPIQLTTPVAAVAGPSTAPIPEAASSSSSYNLSRLKEIFPDYDTGLLADVLRTHNNNYYEAYDSIMMMSNVSTGGKSTRVKKYRKTKKRKIQSLKGKKRKNKKSRRGGVLTPGQEKMLERGFERHKAEQWRASNPEQDLIGMISNYGDLRPSFSGSIANQLKERARFARSKKALMDIDASEQQDSRATERRWNYNTGQRLKHKFWPQELSGGTKKNRYRKNLKTRYRKKYRKR